MNELYDVLKTSKASDFLIREEQTESREAFFIGQKLDMSRAKKVTHTFLTVFVAPAFLKIPRKRRKRDPPGHFPRRNEAGN